MAEEWLDKIETPCIVADMGKVMQNIKKMQDTADRSQCKLRPHIKTHKSVEIARMQMAAGACGITCAKISEAEIMADGGIEDIFIAYPQWGESKIERAVRLRQRIGRLILGVDSFACAENIARIAAKHQTSLELRLEIDTGAKRTGAPYNESVPLAKAIAALPHVRLTGLYTFKGLLAAGKPTLNAADAADEECGLLNDLRHTMICEGLAIREISAGSTPTACACAATRLVDEIRPGTYVFHDVMTCRAGACRYEDIAAFIYVTAVSVPSRDYAVLDGGCKVFPTDIALNREPFFFKGYAEVPGRDNLHLNRLSEEHGMLCAENGETGITAGDVLRLAPVHICPAINLRDFIYVYENGCLRKLRVDARGCSV